MNILFLIMYLLIKLILLNSKVLTYFFDMMKIKLFVFKMKSCQTFMLLKSLKY